jgi:small-conductance mechanosensitive channel
MTEFAERLGIIVRIACAVVAWAFVIRYLRTDWHSSHVGRMMMSLAVIIGVFMTLVSSSLIFGIQFPHWFSFILFIVLLLLELNMHRVFTHEQKKGNESKLAPSPDSVETMGVPDDEIN